MELMVDNRTRGVAVIQPRGRLDRLSAAEFGWRLAAVIGDGSDRLVVDLAGVSFTDSSGLGALIGGLKAARKAGGDLRIAQPDARARNLFELMSLERVLRIYSTVEEALEGYYGLAHTVERQPSAAISARSSTALLAGHGAGEE